MKRRDFLKGFLGAATAAMVLPQVPRVAEPILELKQSPVVHGWVGTSANAGARPITFEMIERAYMDMTMSAPPPVIYVSKTTYDRLQELFGHSDYSLTSLGSTDVHIPTNKPPGVIIY